MQQTHLESIEGHECGAPPLHSIQVVDQRGGDLVILHYHVEQLVASCHLHRRTQLVDALEELDEGPVHPPAHVGEDRGSEGCMIFDALEKLSMNNL